jgi:tetratricopeptide (TPR) repeat protein
MRDLRLGLRQFTLLVILMALAAVSASAQTELIQQATAAMSRGDNDTAITILEKAVAQDPNSAEAHFYLSTAYGSKGQQLGIFHGLKYAPKAKAELEKAVALNPKHVEAHFGLVEFYAAAPGLVGGSYDKAFEQAKEIKAIDPVVGHRAYAFIYLQQKKLDLANKEYTEAIREQPNSAKAYTYFGQFLENVEKNYPGATGEFEMALKIDPNHIPALYHLGKTAALANANLSRGEEALKKYLTYTPKPSEPSLAIAYYFLGVVYEKEGKKPEAKKSYEAALKLNPTHKETTEALKRLS